MTLEYLEGIRTTIGETKRLLDNLGNTVVSAYELLMKVEQGKVSMTEEQKEAAMAQYAARKQAVVDKFQELP